MRFPATTIDLSTLPQPQIINTIAFDDIVAAMRADAKVRAVAAGYDLDTLDLESESSNIIFESCAERELLKRQEVNDDALALLLAFATGPDLEQIGARFGVTRMLAAGVTTPRGSAVDYPADWETDARLRRRIQYAPDAYSNAGTFRAYVFHAMSAGTSADVADVNVLSPVPGQVDVVLLGTSGIISDAAVLRVHDRLFQPDVKPLTDDVRVMKAKVLTYTVSATLRVPRGPSPTAIKTLAEANVRQFSKDNFKIGNVIYTTALLAKLQVANVFDVVMNVPAADLDPGSYAAAQGNYSITTEIVDG